MSIQRTWKKTISQRTIQTLLVTLALCTTTIGFTQQSSDFEEAFDDREKPWEEIAIQLPPAPQQANLVEFYVSPTTTSQSFIDTASLTVGSDGVVRYTIVTKTSGGAINTSYEGIRCATYETKRYAFGHTNGTWSRSRINQWKRVADVGANRQDAALFKDYFCQGSLLAGDATQIVQRLRSQRPLDPSRN